MDSGILLEGDGRDGKGTEEALRRSLDGGGGGELSCHVVLCLFYLLD